MVTIKQLANLANVSRGTVDKVLNNRPGVKKETREKILKIAKEMNYQPNYIGKALVKSHIPVKIGVILTPEYNPFIQELLNGLNHAIDEFAVFGIEVLVKMPLTLEPAEQISILYELKSEGVSSIAVFPINDFQVITLINQFIAEGIPIITFNSEIKEIDSLCFIGQNHYRGGRTAAGLMGKLLPEGGKIGVIISTLNLSCHQDRLRGFQDKIREDYPLLEIVEVQKNQDTKEEAFRITMEYGNKYPDLKAIYITSGGVAGVGSALEIQENTEKMKVICHDVVPDSINLLKSKTVDFVLGQNAYLQGYQIVKILVDYLIKKITPMEYFDVPIDIVTEETL